MVTKLRDAKACMGIIWVGYATSGAPCLSYDRILRRLQEENVTAPAHRPAK
jgi:hypothetical protein